jgi:DNA-3-methyladenine glycosylase II
LVSIFSSSDFHVTCDNLGKKDRELKCIIQTFGYPPMWTRPNSFETLIHIILEQQVSLASALAALNKLREKLVHITPGALLQLTDEELKACYFSKQKTSYARALANAIETNTLKLDELENVSDDEVRKKMITLKGFGNWTIDVYLMFVLRRADIFPGGDLAAVNALKQVKKLPSTTTKEKLLTISAKWKPYRTVATMILWHYYLSIRAKDPSSETQKIKKAVSIVNSSPLL